MKKTLAWFLSLLMLFSMAACAAPQADAPTASPQATEAAPAVTSAPDAAPVNGVFEGTGYGMQGPITVSITVADSAITAIDFVENSETANVAAVAVEPYSRPDRPVPVPGG